MIQKPPGGKTESWIDHVKMNIRELDIKMNIKETHILEIISKGLTYYKMSELIWRQTYVGTRTCSLANLR